MLLSNARVVFPDTVADGLSVLLREDRIAAIDARIDAAPGEIVIDAEGRYLVPGFIDLHIHAGHLGSDCPLDRELDLCAANLPANGTTRYLCTLTSALRGDLPECFHAIRDFLRRDPPGAKPIGVHLEGPYVACDSRGGFLTGQITTPAEFSIDRILDEGAGLIRLMMVSPELAGIGDVIRDCARRGIVVAMGHTRGGLDEYERARDAGATHMTHCYDNRRDFPEAPMGGRGFTIDDLAVADDGVTCELICDGAHVQPVWVKTLYRTKGARGICLVTDSFIAGRRCAEGETFATQGGRTIVVRDGIGRDEKGTLCGSALTQDRAVKRFMDLAGASLSEAVRCASLNPARVVGLDDQFGSIAVGKRADLALLDDDLTPVLSVVDGKTVYDATNRLADLEADADEG